MCDCEIMTLDDQMGFRACRDRNNDLFQFQTLSHYENGPLGTLNARIGYVAECFFRRFSSPYISFNQINHHLPSIIWSSTLYNCLDARGRHVTDAQYQICMSKKYTPHA